MIVVETLRRPAPPHPPFRVPWCQPFGAVWVPVYPAPLGHVLTTWPWHAMPEVPSNYDVKTVDANGWECWTHYDDRGQVVGRMWIAPAIVFMSTFARTFNARFS